MSEELKTCPFCGECDFPPVLTKDRNGPCVICPNCSALGRHGFSDEDAIAAWNTRAQPEPCVSREGVLSAAMERICINSNKDWAEVRDNPAAKIDLIHSIAVDAFYAKPALSTVPASEPAAGWRDIAEYDRERDGVRVNLCWKAEGDFDAHVELGKWSPSKGWCNTYGKAFNGDPDYFMPLPTPPGKMGDR